jgi:hypothetical protein
MTPNAPFSPVENGDMLDIVPRLSGVIASTSRSQIAYLSYPICWFMLELEIIRNELKN